MNIEYRGLSGRVYVIENEKIAGGGEGDIYRIVGDYKLVAKIFRTDKRNSEREEKLCQMVKKKMSEYQRRYITWPQDVIYDANGFAGYIMNRLENMESLTMLYSTEGYDLRYRLLAAINMCIAIEMIHEAGQVCGDLNPQNILINLDKEDEEKGFRVTLVDADSYHFSADEQTYRCEVGLPDYLAPEIQKKMVNGTTLKNAPLPTYTMETDLFALAVHVFCLLMNGCHPFACAKEVGNGTGSTMEQLTTAYNHNSVVAPQPIENIRDGFFPFCQKRDGISPPVYAPEFDSLPNEIQKAFIKTFVDGYEDPQKRTTAEEWIDVLKPYVIKTEKGNSVISCGKGHYYFSVGKGCPLCQIDKKLQVLLGAQSVVYTEPEKLSKENTEFKQESKSIVSGVDPIKTVESKALSQPVRDDMYESKLMRSMGLAIAAMIIIILVVGLAVINGQGNGGHFGNPSTSSSGQQATKKKWTKHVFSVCGVEMKIPKGSECYDSIEHIGIYNEKFSFEDLDLDVSYDDNYSNMSMQDKPPETLINEYKYGDEIIKQKTVQLGEFYFWRLLTKDDDIYSLQYLAVGKGVIYIFSGSSSSEILESDMKKTEKMISSLKINHHPVFIRLFDRNGDEYEYTNTDKRDWGLQIEPNENSDIVYIVDTDEQYIFLLPKGDYTAKLVYEAYDAENIEIVSTSAFTVHEDTSLEKINLEFSK